MPDLLGQIQKELNESLKQKDEVKTSTLRMVMANLRNAQIAKGSELTSAEIVSEIAKDAKRHKESIAAFESGNRSELAEKEKTELSILSKYLPEQLSDDQVDKIVDEVILEVGARSIDDIGKVMSSVMPKVNGKVDGGMVSSRVREKLSKLV